ncbi:GNAT family N-acetyltransferase [Actinomycetospora endophytica]|uniref:GNAT family N-acetyltransferase n=1 Tax=Actinomycetospora endophytica TaxID=2291215 RepID=A0ABS8PEA7_9PSEU|nr:GNAT family N-acetyltransferase [Actinomycetospora endophytica]MCD2196252.1 GNAT family N-acetyltransferase [Actinomycetospora endophytica]
MAEGNDAEVTIDIVDVLDDGVRAAVERLLPQLSRSAAFDGQTLAWVVAHEATTLFVARLGDAVVGALTLVMYPLPTGLRAHIDDVVVDDDVRGRGVGEALVRAALERAVEVGARTVDLTSRPSREAAIRLYERVGFRRRDSTLFRWEPPRDDG